MKKFIVDRNLPEGDQLYCLHTAESEDVTQEYVRRGELSIKPIAEGKAVIDPGTNNPLPHTESHDNSVKIDRSFVFAIHAKDNIYLADFFNGCLTK